MPAVSVRGLAKSYGSIAAVQGVSFNVERGEVFGLLGPNGAGKTTIIEILEGFRRRDRGEVSVLGFDPTTRQRGLRERIGIVLQELAVESMLTVREVLDRNAGYYPRPRPIDDVIELVGLGEKARTRVKDLSGGQQRRLDLGLGIVGNPELLFLDEPTTGFDPSARRGAWELVRQLTHGGTTVILTTHYMDEAEELTDRVTVIARGEFVVEGPPGSLGGRNDEAVIRFVVGDASLVADLPVVPTRVSGGAIELRTTDEVAVLNRLTTWAIERHVELTGLVVERLTLEDVYLRLVGSSESAT